MYALATKPGVLNPKIPEKKVKDRGFATAPDGRFIIKDDNDKDSDAEERNEKKRKTSFLQNDLKDDYSKYLIITLFRHEKKFTYHEIYARRFYFVEDEDDVSIVTTKTADKKRKYSESILDAMSLKSQSTSRYRGKFFVLHSIPRDT